MSAVAPELVSGAQRGDRHAFALLVEHLYPRGLRFAQQMLGNAQDAEEALQDTFVRVHDNLSRFIPGTPFEPWFFRILANRCRTLGGKRKRHHAVIAYDDNPPDAVHDERPMWEFNDWREEVERALITLAPDQREAFLLRHVEDMSYDEMAVVTGVRAATLRMRVSRACDALRQQLSGVEIHG